MSGAAPTLFAAMGAGGEGGPPLGADWGNSRLNTGTTISSWRCLLPGASVAAPGGVVELHAAFGELPVAGLAPS